MSAHKRDFENIREYELYLENAINHFKTIKTINQKWQSQQNNPKTTTKSAPQVTTLPDAIK